METIQTFLYALLHFLAQSAPYVVLGYLVAAVIKEFVPLQVFVRLFGGGGVKPLLRAVGVGCMLPICSCGVIPIGVGAFRCGARRGTVLAFISSGPAISPVAVLLAVTFLGWQLALCFAVTALVGALAIGAIGNRLLSGPDEDALRAERQKKKATAAEVLPSGGRGSLPAKIRGAARWAFWDLGTDISVDLLIGLSLAAGLLTALPETWITTWLGQQSLTTLLAMIAIGIPLYTCTVPSIPIVAALVSMGLPPGAAIAYLISGPATNLGDINVLRRQFGWKTAAVFVGGLFAACLAGGLITDHLVFPGFQGNAAFAGEGAASRMSPFLVGDDRAARIAASVAALPTWHFPFLAILIAALVVGLARRGHAAAVRLGWLRLSPSEAS